MAAPARVHATPSATIVSTESVMPGCSRRLQAPFNATSIQTLRMPLSVSLRLSLA